LISPIRSGGLVYLVLLLTLNARQAQGPASRTVHVFVALADNQSQGIIPVPAKIGNGEDPENNLYWGSAYGIKTFFARSADWVRIVCGEKPQAEILERCVFKHRATNVYLVADAYRGREIRRAILDFLASAAGDDPETETVSGSLKLPIRGGANLVAYIGHDGLMDFQLFAVSPQERPDPTGCGRPGLCEQTIFHRAGASLRRLSIAVDDRFDGSRSLYAEECSGWLDCRGK
jgi:hypothetical protein